MAINSEYISLDDPDVASTGFGDHKTKTLFNSKADPWLGKKYRINFGAEEVAIRAAHDGPLYELCKTERAEKIDEKDRTVGAVVLPHPETGMKAVYRPKDDNKPHKLRCLSQTGSCPACITVKAKYDKKNKLRVKQATKHFGTNVFVWKTDVKGNLLGKNTNVPIDFCGRPIQLDRESNWDEQSYKMNAAGEIDVVDEPTGETMFLKFNADLFVDMRDLKRKTSVQGGKFTHLDFLIECMDTFKNMKLEPASLMGLHSVSAGNYNHEMVAADIEKFGIKSLGAFLCKETDQAGMVYQYGLEADLLPQEDPNKNEGSLSEPMGSSTAGGTVMETAPARTPPPPPVKAAVPPPPPVKTAPPPPPPKAPAAEAKVPETTAEMPAKQPTVKVTVPPPPAAKKAIPPPPPPVKAAPPPPVAAPKKDAIDALGEI